MNNELCMDDDMFTLNMNIPDSPHNNKFSYDDITKLSARKHRRSSSDQFFDPTPKKDKVTRRLHAGRTPRSVDSLPRSSSAKSVKSRRHSSGDIIPFSPNKKLEENVNVLLRIRPPLPREMSAQWKEFVNADPIDNTVELISSSVPGNTINVPAKPFQFDHVLTDDFTQKDIFDKMGKRVTNLVLKGYHCTVFAYGQTGSGKTYTIQGPSESISSSSISHEHRGLMPRVFEYLFEKVNRIDGEVDVMASFLEIYNDNVYDLLEPSNRSLNIREHPDEGIYVEKLCAISVNDVKTALRIMNKGIDNRTVAETSMNRESSRSHSVFTLTIRITRTDDDGTITEMISKFHLCDLAGSERLNKSGTTGALAVETTAINQSLSALGNVIIALSDMSQGKKQRHVPYRDSKLTFLLKDSLGKNALTFLIACISPSVLNAGETLSTLQFASRAKSIKVSAKAGIKRNMSKEALTKENDSLKNMIRQLREKLQHYNYTNIKNDNENNNELKPLSPSNTPRINNKEKSSEMIRQLIQREKSNSEEVERLKKEIRLNETTTTKFTNLIESQKMMLKMRDESISVLRQKLTDAMDDKKRKNISPFEVALKLEVGRLQQELETQINNCELESLIAEKSVQVVKLENEIERLKELQDTTQIDNVEKLNSLNGYLTQTVIQLQDGQIDASNSVSELKKLKTEHNETLDELKRLETLLDEESNELENSSKEITQLKAEIIILKKQLADKDEDNQYKQSAKTLKLCLEKAVEKESNLKQVVNQQKKDLKKLKTAKEQAERYAQKLVNEIEEKTLHTSKANRALVELTKSVTTLEAIVKKQHEMLINAGISVTPTSSITTITTI